MACMRFVGFGLCFLLLVLAGCTSGVQGNATNVFDFLGTPDPGSDPPLDNLDQRYADPGGNPDDECRKKSDCPGEKECVSTPPGPRKCIDKDADGSFCSLSEGLHSCTFGLKPELRNVYCCPANTVCSRDPYNPCQETACEEGVVQCGDECCDQRDGDDADDRPDHICIYDKSTNKFDCTDDQGYKCPAGTVAPFKGDYYCKLRTGPPPITSSNPKEQCCFFGEICVEDPNSQFSCIGPGSTICGSFPEATICHFGQNSCCPLPAPSTDGTCYEESVLECCNDGKFCKPPYECKQKDSVTVCIDPADPDIEIDTQTQLELHPELN